MTDLIKSVVWKKAQQGLLPSQQQVKPWILHYTLWTIWQMSWWNV